MLNGMFVLTPRSAWYPLVLLLITLPDLIDRSHGLVFQDNSVGYVGVVGFPILRCSLLSGKDRVVELFLPTLTAAVIQPRADLLP